MLLEPPPAAKVIVTVGVGEIVSVNVAVAAGAFELSAVTVNVCVPEGTFAFQLRSPADVMLTPPGAPLMVNVGAGVPVELS